MGFTDDVSAVIFGLIIIGVFTFIIMARFVTGSILDLKLGERIIIFLGFIGMMMVCVYAVFELIFHIVI